jgi:hypothetical protein
LPFSETPYRTSAGPVDRPCETTCRNTFGSLRSFCIFASFLDPTFQQSPSDAIARATIDLDASDRTLRTFAAERAAAREHVKARRARSLRRRSPHLFADLGRRNVDVRGMAARRVS